jgi:hypothetical protein
MDNKDLLKAQTDSVLREEREWLRCSNGEELSALCLSGGGIRSATFCLGVLQALAQKGLLDKFHDLSTVSGGGYIGSWLAAWIAREQSQAKVVQQLANSGRAEDPVPVQRLRAYTNYLSPVWGLSTDFLSMVAIFLRNLFLNWLVLVPLIVAAAMVPRVQLAMVNQRHVDAWAYNGLLAVAGALLVLALAYVNADLPGNMPRRPPADRFRVFCFLPLLGAAFILSWLVAWDANALLALKPSLIPAPVFLFLVGGALHLAGVGFGTLWRRRRGLEPLHLGGFGHFVVFLSGGAAGLMLYGLLLRIPPAADAAAREWYATWSAPLLLLAFWVACTLYTALTSRLRGEPEREWMSRATAWCLGAALAWLGGALLVIEAPRLVFAWLVAQKSEAAPFAAGGLATLLGAAASAAGYWSKAGGKLRTQAETLMQLTGLRLVQLLSATFVIVILVGASIAASCTLRLISRVGVDGGILHASVIKAQGDPGAQALLAARAAKAYAEVLKESTPPLVGGAGLLLLAMGVLFSRWVGVNTFSLHNMYGNRLARAYLGASRIQRAPHWFTGFDPEDNIGMAQRAEARASEPPRLFHVVNVALNIVAPAGDRLEWQQRMAAPFTMSPLHCGSSALGYAPTRDYGSKEGGMSYARAMAISGAAATPNMGYHTSKVVAFVMTLFNARLGWWIPNPRAEKKAKWANREPSFGVRPLIDELLARVSTDRGYVYVSDGGHFENLGLYEMVRRGCKRILVVDAGCDPQGEFEDLEGAIRKVRVDFGVVIRFNDGDALPTLEQAKAARRYIAEGRILYPDGSVGELVYMKPALIGDEPLDVLRFAAKHCKKGKAFPHQPTSDQFFDESQFESYRVLGMSAVERHFTSNWTSWLVKPAPAAAPAPIATKPATTQEEALNFFRALLDQVRPGSARASGKQE